MRTTIPKHIRMNDQYRIDFTTINNYIISMDDDVEMI
jgi:hypothetical protein